MRYLKIYEDFDFKDDDFDFDEEPYFDFESFKIMDLWEQYKDIDTIVNILNDNLKGKIINVYDYADNVVLYNIDIHGVRVHHGVSNALVRQWVIQKQDLAIIDFEFSLTNSEGRTIDAIWMKDKIKTV